MEQPGELPQSPWMQILEYPYPAPGARNVMHFLMPGTDCVVAKTVPWKDPETGEETGVPPFSLEGFQTPLTLRSDYVANMEGDSSRYPKLVRHPMTGEVLQKFLPWETSTVVSGIGRTTLFDLSKFVPGLQVSPGNKIQYKSNPNLELDDPSDRDNVRYFSQTSMGRQLNRSVGHVYTGRCYREIEDGTRPHPGCSIQHHEWAKEFNTAVFGLNLGGTIVMRKVNGKLVPGFSLDDSWKENFKDGFPNSRFASVGFNRTRINPKGEIAEGMDSSQMQIEFVGDTVNAMVSIWNNLLPEQRKDFAGFVVACGTDTIVETTTYLKMMLGPNCPFSAIVVGAMKPTGEESSDALPNLRKAYEHLHNLHRHDPPLATVAMRVEGGLYDPTKTRKMHSDKASAFDGKKLVNTETFESIQANANKFYHVQDEDFDNSYEEAVILRCADQVEFVPPELSKDPFIYEDRIRKSEAKAIVIETYASYTFPTNILEAIAKGANGRPVFVVNSIEETGEVVEHDYEPTVAMTQLGMHPCRLTQHAIKAKINYGLTLFGNDTTRLVDFITQNDFVGEQYEGFQSFPPVVMEKAGRLRAALYEKLGVDVALERARDPRSIAAIFDQTRASVSEAVSNEEVEVEGLSDAQLLQIHVYLEQFSDVELIEAVRSGQLDWINTVANLDDEATTVQEIMDHQQTVNPKGMPIELERIVA